MPLRVDTLNYLIPRWHVCSNKIPFYQKTYITHHIGPCLSKKFLVWFSSNTYLYILFGKPFASSYSIIAVRDCVTS